MRIGKQSAAGLLTAVLLFPMPALAIHQSLSKATGKVTVKQAGSATEIIQHENQERLEYISFARQLRAEFRGQRGPAIQASVNRYLKNLQLDLRAHWRVEGRTGVASPFNFPSL